ncbi:putative amino acid ABC transporter, permease protein [Streptococcus gallolyticus UCN34]|uniref:Amino acid ABC transporter, permease protein n=1 Tax=Streptococcus gallolyticus (strain UCN34) TaxID=637909 RepID=A0AA36JYS1_STRG3|nr:amino acid ABC transporter permease [Streptococcus gallolyticus]CBI13728.1 putative amino acid ABC transporter, permease protein [Streptococcus gallolyticus UCN34]
MKGGYVVQDSGLQVLFQGNNLWRLFQGLLVTINISLLSIVISIVFGFLFGFVMTSRFRIVRVLAQIYLEFIRIMPQLVLLFLVYFGLARTFNLNLSGEVAALIVFSMWGIAEMGDLVRGALTSLPKHQFESGLALGLTKTQLFIYVIIPQILRRLLPQAVNLMTRMIKTTSLIVLIGVVEVVKVGQQIIEANRLTVPSAAIWIYGLIFLMYFAVCFPISRLSMYLEKVWKE